jgi:enamine deaminase RidA (YjgF/YER057c/UK114 family)
MRIVKLVCTVITMNLCSSLPAAEPPKFVEPQPKTGSSLAVVVDSAPLAHTTQILPLSNSSPTEPAEQVRQAFGRLEEILKSAGSTTSQIVKLNVYVNHPSVTTIVEQQLAAKFKGDHKPAVSFVTTPLPDPSQVVGLDAVAVSTQTELKRLPPKTKGQPSPAAILPAGPRVYISGQAEKGDGTLADATKQTMKSLFDTLKWMELSPADVVEVKAFLTPMKDAKIAIDEIIKSFGDETPAPLSVVEWIAGANSIEIELVAAARPRDNAPPCEYLTPPGMTASPVFCRVVRADAPKTIYISGLYGSTDEPSGETEVRELFAITERLTAATGSDLKHLVKATYYVTDNDVSAWHNKLRPMYYDPERPPAASKALVHGTGREKRTITWDLIAVPK